MKRKKAVCILAAVFLLFASLCFSACGEIVERASDYTDEEHLARVTERIEKKYMTDDSPYTSFAVYPLYDINDKVKYFLVEFEPIGFVYVIIRDQYTTPMFGTVESLYGLSGPHGLNSSNEKLPWSRYTIDSTNSQPWPDTDKRYERDENGEKVEYYKSPYAVAGIKDEKRYLLYLKDEKNNSYSIHAIKTDDGYLNLISMTAVNIEDGKLTEQQADHYVSFVIKKFFDL